MLMPTQPDTNWMNIRGGHFFVYTDVICIVYLAVKPGSIICRRRRKMASGPSVSHASVSVSVSTPSTHLHSPTTSLAANTLSTPTTSLLANTLSPPSPTTRLPFITSKPYHTPAIISPADLPTPQFSHPAVHPSEDDIRSMTAAAMRDLCHQLRIASSGNKNRLINNLLSYYNQGS